jgi:serine/threonine-protein kinase RsbW
MTARDSQRVCWLHSTADVPRVLEAVAGEMATAGYTEDDVFAVCLGLNEALLNAIQHGNQSDPAKRVRVAYQVGPTQVAVEVEDEGPGFDPDQVSDPRAPEKLERLNGRLKPALQPV